MPRKGENIYKRKDGRWEGRFIKGHSSEGKAIYGYVYAYSYKEVRNKLSSAASGQEEIHIIKNDEINFHEIATQWLNSQRSKAKESTCSKYTNILYYYVLPYIGGKRPKEITIVTINSLCETLLKSGGKDKNGLSEKTVTDTLSVIKSIMKYSESLGHAFPFDERAIHIRQKYHELRILSENDQRELYTYLCSTPNQYNIGVLICLLTGIRIGEVCALSWDDISFYDHTIRIRKTAQRIQDSSESSKKTKIIITSPKTDMGKRIIPMPENLERILSDYKHFEDGFIISKDGIKLTEPRVLQYHFKKILKRLNIDDVNFHVLRHTFATRCIEVGFDVKSLSEILGHSNVSITMNRYVHPSMELKKENMKRLSSLFSVN